MSTIQENLRATLLSLKQISDRLKSLVTNSSTKTDVSNAKGDIITAIGNIPEPDLSSLATESNATSNKNAIIAAMPAMPTDYAKETSVKDGNDTAIGMLKDASNGLSAIKTQAANAATDAAAAKTAAQGITGYALQGNDSTATNTAIKHAVDAIPTTAPATPTNVSDAQAAIIAQIQANAGVPTLTIPSTTASQELAPNTLYVFAERTTDLTLTLGTPIVCIANEYHLFLVIGSTAPTITWPTGISWNGGSAPTIAADKTYEVSILNNVAAYFEIDNPVLENE